MKEVQTIRESIDQSKLKPEYRAVLDWICRQPSRVYDFTEIADALKLKRGFVENAIATLKHQRHGSILAVQGPFGDALRSRHAYLPKDAPIRAEYAPLEHPELTPETAAAKPQKASSVRSAEKAKRKTQQLAARAQKKEARRRADLTIFADAMASRDARLARKKASTAPVAALADEDAFALPKTPPQPVKNALRTKEAKA